jgi:mevalonate kinase
MKFLYNNIHKYENIQYNNVANKNVKLIASKGDIAVLCYNGMLFWMPAGLTQSMINQGPGPGPWA